MFGEFNNIISDEIIGPISSTRRLLRLKFPWLKRPGLFPLNWNWIIYLTKVEFFFSMTNSSAKARTPMSRSFEFWFSSRFVFCSTIESFFLFLSLLNFSTIYFLLLLTREPFLPFFLLISSIIRHLLLLKSDVSIYKLTIWFQFRLVNLDISL